MKKYGMICVVLCTLMCSLSGCRTEKNMEHIEADEENITVNDKEKNEDGTNKQNSAEYHTKSISENGAETIPEDALEPSAEPKMRLADYGVYFQSIKGCAVLLDAQTDTYTFYQEEMCREQVSPYSTFKIVSTLMGLHNQIITDEESRLGYDGTLYPMETWNADLDLAEAFQSSCVWYFRKLIDEVGQEEVQKELAALNYGNCDCSEWEGNSSSSISGLNGFWLDSSLKISPQEQVEILRDIFEGRTVYSQKEISILKAIMLIETAGDEKIYGKTGTGNHTGWFTGLAETETGTVYFAVYINDSDNKEVNGAAAREIAWKLLTEEKILK